MARILVLAGLYSIARVQILDGRPKKLAAEFSGMNALNLSDDELQDAAQAARIACVQAEHDAERQSNPRIKSMFDSSARRWRELANKFERARAAGMRPNNFAGM
jgi:hypothetical protein